MNLDEEILVTLLEGRTVHVKIEGLDIQKLVESSCYQALEQIRSILRDDSLSDPECFQKIEKIVEVYERLGGSTGGRHDFG